MRRGMVAGHRVRAALLAGGLLFGGVGGAVAAQSAPAALPVAAPVVDPTVAPDRNVEPVILTGAQFPGWAVPQNATAKAPFTDLADCNIPQAQQNPNDPTNTDNCQHNGYATPEVDTSGAQNQAYGQAPVKKVMPDQMLGYRWTGKRFVQIPFQVDKVFTRYLHNDASGFAFYSGDDQHTTYQFDREGFRYTRSQDPAHPCVAVPDSPTAKAPIQQLTTQDEISFMFSDSGDKAPKGTAWPKGIVGARAVRIDDPSSPGSVPRYVYVMVADPKGGPHVPKPAFSASNGYVRYRRDPNAGLFQFSQSNYSNYGNAATGEYCDANGNLVVDANGKPKIGRRRPGDNATITTSRYSFRYDGRWLMTGIGISPDNNGLTSGDYGPNVVDRWKARAFAQDPSSKTPCCGFEEEDTHWGGSSTLLGERVGPVRAIRATWGADSGTNVIRMETFYRDQMRQKSWLRVHVIPPLDGIYSQWDFRAGRMTKYFNPNQQSGVPVDGRNDTVFGNLDDPCNKNYDGTNEGTGINALAALPGGGDPNQAYRQLYQGTGICAGAGQPWSGQDPYHQSVNVADPTFEGLNASLQWNEVAGPVGTIVDRTQMDKVTDTTPGGAAQSLMALPYYRDDSCFDDGTGNDPGYRLRPGSSNEPRTYVDAATGQTLPRKCWAPSDGIPTAADAAAGKYYQGDIGTHGLHLMFQLESDNARQTVPIDEIVSETRMVMLPGQQGNVGEKYGREFEKPLVANVAPVRKP
jgi:hypothetical protein